MDICHGVQQVVPQAVFGWSSKDVDVQIADIASKGKAMTS